MTFLQKLILGFKQRLIKLNLIHGLYFTPLGLIGLWASFYALQRVIQIAAIVGFLYLTVEGLRRIIANPVKTDIKLDMEKAAHWIQSAVGYDPTGVTSASTDLAANAKASPTEPPSTL